MNDTPPDIERRYREMLMAKSGAERMAMGSGMFDCARRIMIASFPPGLSKEEFRRMLLERTYPELEWSCGVSKVERSKVGKSKV